MCSILVQSVSAELLREVKLMVWDEAPSQHQHCAKAIDRTLRDIMQHLDSPFGDKVVVFKGDFLQCLPMVSRSSWAAIIFAALSHLILWRQVHVLTLMENMRLRVDPFSRPYVEYLLRVDNG
jgi:hypothetical protein